MRGYKGCLSQGYIPKLGAPSAFYAQV